MLSQRRLTGFAILASALFLAGSYNSARVTASRGQDWFKVPALEPSMKAPLRALVVDRHRLPYPPPSVRLVVLKDKHRVDLYSGKLLVKSYLSAFGFSISLEKEVSGDYRTPEGVYYFVTRPEIGQTKFYGFMGIDYPNVRDAIRGLKGNRITLAVAEQVIGAVIRRATWQPWVGRTDGGLWYTGLGGEVGFHGGNACFTDGDNVWGKNWTLGCIAVADEDMDELREAAGTRWSQIPILILKSEDLIQEGGRYAASFDDFLKNPAPYIDCGTLARDSLLESMPDDLKRLLAD